MVSKLVMKLSTLSSKGGDPLLLCGGTFVSCFALFADSAAYSKNSTSSAKPATLPSLHLIFTTFSRQFVEPRGAFELLPACLVAWFRMAKCEMVFIAELHLLRKI